MNLDSHRRALHESLKAIERSIQDGLDKNQRAIGFHCSAAAIDLLEIHLHQEGSLSVSAGIKHDWFASTRKAEQKIPFDFTKKREVVKLICSLEEKRNLLIYGKEQSRTFIEGYLTLFNSIKELFADLGTEP